MAASSASTCARARTPHILAPPLYARIPPMGKLIHARVNMTCMPACGTHTSTTTCTATKRTTRSHACVTGCRSAPLKRGGSSSAPPAGAAWPPHQPPSSAA